MKSGISSAVSEQFEYRVPPHPWEEGGQFDRSQSSLNSFCKNGGLGVLPLPKGEGRGEGERRASNQTTDHTCADRQVQSHPVKTLKLTEFNALA